MASDGAIIAGDRPVFRARRLAASCEPYTLVFIYLLTFAVFVLDLTNAVGLAAGVLYIPLVLTASRFQNRHMAWILAGIASALTIAGAVLPHVLDGLAIVNRLLSIGAILLTASAVSQEQVTKRRLAAAIAAAEQAEAERSRLLRDASHDFRNALNAVVGFTELLKEDCLPSQRDAISAIEQGGRHLLDTVENLIDLTALDEQGPCLSVLDLNCLLSEALTKARVTGEERSVMAVWDPPFDGLPQIHADQWAVRRILDNLFQNAIKYSPVGGRVRMRLRIAPTELIIEISDEGCGARPGMIRALGQSVPGSQRSGGPPGKAAGEGLDIGLSLAAKLTALTGGRLEITSQPGRGTTASLALPLANRQPANCPPAI